MIYMRMRRTATKHYEIREFREIVAEGGYRTPTGLKFMVRYVDNECRLYVDNFTMNMIVDIEGRTTRMEVDEMERPYMLLTSHDIANEIKVLLVEAHTKHGLE